MENEPQEPMKIEMGIVELEVLRTCGKLKVEKKWDENSCYRHHDIEITATKHPNPWGVVRLHCYRELGWALFYMDWLWAGDNSWKSQRTRVEALCKESVDNREIEDIEYWQKFKERISDEIENMC